MSQALAMTRIFPKYGAPRDQIDVSIEQPPLPFEHRMSQSERAGKATEQQASPFYQKGFL
jgi:hypothetical protein